MGIYPAERAGVLSFSVSIHNVPPDQQDPNAYLPDNYADENENYYKYALLGAIRAIDYIFTRSDFDGQNVGVTGISQGGGLSLCLSGIDERVNLLMYGFPVLSQNAGLVHGKAGGFPNYIKRSRLEHNRQSHEDSTINATRYYDAMFLAQNCNFPVMAAVGYIDNVTPLATGLASFNQLPNTAPRKMIHSTNLGHVGPQEFFQGRFDFIHRYFPSTVETTPWPWNNNSGYHIDAGQDTTILIDNTLSLSGLVELNTTSNPLFKLEWTLIDGPGNVIFSQKNNYNTTATFDTEGIYTLQFMGTDTSLLTSNNRFFTLTDYITITINKGGNIAPLPIELISFEASSVVDGVNLSWITSSEINNEGFEIEHSTDGRIWERIDFVPGFGNTTDQQNYRYLHESPSEGLNYYRLKQLDFDGVFSYTDIEVVEIKIDKEIKIYPSLATNEINIQLNQAANRETTIEIFDFMGRVVHVENLAEDSSEHVINISNLHQGHYILRINRRGDNFSGRFLKK